MTAHNQHMSFLNSAFSFPSSAKIIAMICALGLAFVFILQFAFDVQPCILCLWQRVPYGVGLTLAVIALAWKRHIKILLWFIALTFVVSAGLAFFHTGVEQHWWLGTSGCSIRPLSGASVEDLRTQLLHTMVAHCDEISWTFLGLSLANWNVPLSLALAAFAGLAATKNKP